jgi:uncharacterized protein with beta-barrel porin domain
MHFVRLKLRHTDTYGRVLRQALTQTGNGLGMTKAMCAVERAFNNNNVSTTTRLAIASGAASTRWRRRLVLTGASAWAHDFNPDRNIAATFQTLPGASFVVNGAALASDAALVTASAETRWLNGFSVAATFEGEFSDVTESYAGKGVVRYAW